MRRAPLLALMLAFAPARADSDMAAARYANTQLPDPAQERSAKALMETLRCLVCQGQSIADSDADLAGDMRSLVRQRIREGERPEAVRAWLVRRYGAWISYDPPMNRATWPLWLAPIAMALAAIAIASGSFRRRR